MKYYRIIVSLLIFILHTFSVLAAEKRYNGELNKNLISAIKAENIKEIKKLLKNNADPNAKTLDGTPAITLTLRSMKISANVLLTGNTRQDFRRDSTIIICNILVSAGVDVNAKNSNGDPPLLFAIARGDLKFIDLLIDAGVDVNETAGDGRPLLYVVSYDGNMEIVKRLLKTVLMLMQFGRKMEHLL